MKFTFSVQLARKTPVLTHPRFTNRRKVSLLKRVRRHFKTVERRENLKSPVFFQQVLS
jgi:hypothetical protein